METSYNFIVLFTNNMNCLYTRREIRIDLSGSGTIKSYLKSYFWALVALSQGDDRAQLTVEKIEKLSNKLNAEDGQNWAAELTQVQDDALEYWISTR